MPQIKAINPLTFEIIQPLLQPSLDEGYGFIQTLWDEYQSGKNRFDDPGAALLGMTVGAGWVAIGGVHPDPYESQPIIGRVRHVYVLPGYRRGGFGRQLVEALINHAAGQFTTLTLRTLTDHGCAFYAALGFSNTPRFTDSTHWMDL